MLLQIRRKFMLLFSSGAHHQQLLHLKHLFLLLGILQYQENLRTHENTLVVLHLTDAAVILFNTWRYISGLYHPQQLFLLFGEFKQPFRLRCAWSCQHALRRLFLWRRCLNIMLLSKISEIRWRNLFFLSLFRIPFLALFFTKQINQRIYFTLFWFSLHFWKITFQANLRRLILSWQIEGVEKGGNIGKGVFISSGMWCFKDLLLLRNWVVCVKNGVESLLLHLIVGEPSTTHERRFELV